MQILGKQVFQLVNISLQCLFCKQFFHDFLQAKTKISVK